MKFVSIEKVPPVKREHLQEEFRSLTSQRRVKLGKRGELAAASFLQDLGYTILESNHRSRRGEADLILLDGDTLVFCEVKTKTSVGTGHAAEAYSARQQSRLRHLILRYLQRSNWPGPLRVDVVALQRDPSGPHYQIHHYKDAIPLEDNW
jgi:putative endonuclease